MPPQPPQPQPRPKQHRISYIIAGLMLAVALFFDGLTFAAQWLNGIVFIGTLAQLLVTALVSTWAWLTFYLWFKLNGISFLGPKRIAAFPLAAVIKEIPVVGGLPAWTAAVFFLISTTRAEELLEKVPGGEKLAKVAQASGGKSGAAIGTPPKGPPAPSSATAPPQNAHVPPRLSDVRSPA